MHMPTVKYLREYIDLNFKFGVYITIHCYKASAPSTSSVSPQPPYSPILSEYPEPKFNKYDFPRWIVILFGYYEGSRPTAIPGIRHFYIVSCPSPPSFRI